MNIFLFHSNVKKNHFILKCIIISNWLWLAIKNVLEFLPVSLMMIMITHLYYPCGRPPSHPSCAPCCDQGEDQTRNLCFPWGGEREEGGGDQGWGGKGERGLQIRSVTVQIVVRYKNCIVLKENGSIWFCMCIDDDDDVSEWVNLGVTMCVCVQDNADIDSVD